MQSSAITKQRRARALDLLTDSRLFKEFAYIDGAWQGSGSGRSIAVTDPGSGDWIGQVPAMSAAESCVAVAAAERAFPAWAALLPQQRAQVLRRWFDQITANREDLALLMTLEQGKPISEARGEIDYAASFVEFYAEEAKRTNIETVTSHLPGAAMRVRRQPMGVAALVTPWNFPSAMITRKAAAALAAGCTTVVHPSKETPFSALALAELAERAGSAGRRVQCRHRRCAGGGCAHDTVGGSAGTVLHRLDRGRAACSTGSARRPSRALILELGGHAPFLVFADADLDRAVAGAISAKFATSGQDCLGCQPHPGRAAGL